METIHKVKIGVVQTQRKEVDFEGYDCEKRNFIGSISGKKV